MGTIEGLGVTLITEVVTVVEGVVCIPGVMVTGIDVDKTVKAGSGVAVGLVGVG